MSTVNVSRGITMLKNTLSLAAAISVAISTMTLSTTTLAATAAKTNQFWWPEQLNLSPLRQHGAESNPYGEQYNYAKEFATIDIKQLKQDIENDVNGCEPLYYISAEDASCLPKPVEAAQAVSSSAAVNSAASVSKTAKQAPAGYYQWGWCTYGAWQMTGWAGAWGDAKFWDDNARRDGHVVSSTPAVGAIFVDNSGHYGHVGVVVGVSGDTVTVRDMNYSGFGEWTTRQVNASRYVYIHP